MKHCTVYRIPVLATLLLLLLGTGVLPSCTVKDDRELCPCWLTLSFDGMESLSGGAAVRGFRSEGEVFGAIAPLGPVEDSIWRTPVTRGFLVAMSWRMDGVDEPGCDMESGLPVVKAPEGEAFPRLFSWCENEDCSGGSARDTVRFHKQFSLFRIDIGKDPGTLSRYTFRFVSGWNGVSIADASPVAGAFGAVVTADGEQTYVSVSVPRQGDDLMTMEVAVDGGPFRTFGIGAYLAGRGFDWYAEDLADVYITFDIYEGIGSAIIDQWDDRPLEEQTFD